MAPVSLPHDARAGPTKPDVRAVLPSKLDLGPTDHFAEVGSCTGAVTIEAARRAGRVTALERKPNRLEVTERNLAANDRTAEVALREAEAPAGLPADADALFLGGSRNYEVAGAATDAFRERGLLGEVIQFQVSDGYELAGATSFDSDTPVYMLVGGTAEVGTADVVYSPGRLSRPVGTGHVPEDRVGDVDFPMTRDEERAMEFAETSMDRVHELVPDGTLADRVRQKAVHATGDPGFQHLVRFTGETGDEPVVTGARGPRGAPRRHRHHHD